MIIFSSRMAIRQHIRAPFDQPLDQHMEGAGAILFFSPSTLFFARRRAIQKGANYGSLFLPRAGGLAFDQLYLTPARPG